jgi:hypothetical protein
LHFIGVPFVCLLALPAALESSRFGEQVIIVVCVEAYLKTKTSFAINTTSVLKNSHDLIWRQNHDIFMH